MSAIANFKKRREAEKAQQSPTATETTATPAPENEALQLLAALLGCEVDQAIEKAREAVEKNIHFVNVTIGFDTAEGQDRNAHATVTTDDQGNIASVTEYGPFDVSHDENGKIIISGGLEQTAAELEDSAATVSESADKVSNAAGDLDDAVSSVDQSASNLAYTTDDLGQVAAELKEATAELKKPSAAPASSRGAKAAAPKNSSKK
nr:hypothetical protein [uncultured Shewanella sp.]